MIYIFILLQFLYLLFYIYMTFFHKKQKYHIYGSYKLCVENDKSRLDKESFDLIYTLKKTNSSLCGNLYKFEVIDIKSNNPKYKDFHYNSSLDLFYSYTQSGWLKKNNSSLILYKEINEIKKMKKLKMKPI